MLYRLFLLAARVAVILALLSPFPLWEKRDLVSLFLEINSSLPGFYAGLSAILSAFFFLTGMRAWGTLAFLSALIQATFLFSPSFEAGPGSCSGKNQLKLLYVNVYVHNENNGGILELIHRESPDVVFLTEVSAQRLQSLGLESSFPYSFRQPGLSADGNAIYSRYPLSDVKRFPHGAYFAALTATLSLTKDSAEAFKIPLFLLHAPPPPSDPGGEYRFFLLNQLAQQISARGGNRAVVIGDFNTAISNPMFERMKRALGMTLVQGDRRVRATWQSRLVPFFYSTIDHLFIGRDMRGCDYVVGPDIGSDHFPILSSVEVIK